MTLRADNRLSDTPMQELHCRRCAARVLVRKSSWNQTSVQWDAAASARCQERADTEQLATFGGRGLFLACSALADSITEVARRGGVSIVDDVLPAR